MTNFVPAGNLTAEEIYKHDDIDRIGSYLILKDNETDPAPFCFPIWASYITAYARLKLWREMKDIDPLYCDTDSIITDKIIPTSNKLGALKIERTISDLVIVKPKFYAYIHEKGFKPRLKGAKLSRDITFDGFKDIIKNKRVEYIKFMKLKESLRQNIPLNSVMDQVKIFSLEDNKRLWPNKFDLNSEQDSEPII